MLHALFELNCVYFGVWINLFLLFCCLPFSAHCNVLCVLACLCLMVVSSWFALWMHQALSLLWLDICSLACLWNIQCLMFSCLLSMLHTFQIVLICLFGINVWSGGPGFAFVSENCLSIAISNVFWFACAQWLFLFGLLCGCSMCCLCCGWAVALWHICKTFYV